MNRIEQIEEAIIRVKGDIDKHERRIDSLEDPEFFEDPEGMKNEIELSRFDSRLRAIEKAIGLR